MGVGPDPPPHPAAARPAPFVASRHYLFASPWGSGSPGQGTGHYLRRGLNPFPAGAYLLKARKRVYTLTPIRPRFREKPAVIGGLVKPTTRNPS